MFKLRRLPKRRRLPIQPPQPPMNTRVSTPNIPQIRLKMLHINSVEPHDRGVETDIGLCDFGAPVVRSWTRAEVFLDFVQGFEEGEETLFVCFLGRRESSFVDSVVDQVVRPFVVLVDLAPQVLRVEYNVLLNAWKVVELGVEHADDVRGFVGDDLILLDVVKSRDCKAARVLRVNREIDILQMRVLLMPGDWVRVHILTRRIPIPLSRKSPPLVRHMPMHTRKRDNILEAFQLAHDQSAVCPGTGIGDVEMIASLFGRKLGAC